MMGAKQETGVTPQCPSGHTTCPPLRIFSPTCKSVQPHTKTCCCIWRGVEAIANCYWGVAICKSSHLSLILAAQGCTNIRLPWKREKRAPSLDMTLAPHKKQQPSTTESWVGKLSVPVPKQRWVVAEVCCGDPALTRREMGYRLRTSEEALTYARPPSRHKGDIYVRPQNKSQRS